MRRGRKFELDRANGKLMGVCAGIAEATGCDATLIRVGMVVSTIAFPWMICFYFVAAWIGKPKAADAYGGTGWSPRRSSVFEERSATTDLDRRLAEVDSYVSTQNDSLAREIESLR